MFTNFEVDTLHLHDPARDRATPEVHLVSREAVAALLAGGARIHVDFHADRHFDDLRGFPGHLAFLFEPDDFRPPG
jgi:hypothetical protein